MDKMKKLEQLQEQMRSIEKEQSETRRKIARVSSKLSLLRAITTKDIALEKNDEGKPLYSNDSLRRAELTIRLSENEEYKKLIEENYPLREKHRHISFEWNLLTEQVAILIADRNFV